MLNDEYFYCFLLDFENNPIIPDAKLAVVFKRAAKRTRLKSEACQKCISGAKLAVSV